ncbi:MAG: nitrogen fixation protein NifQ [Actinomycetota bacterium]|nr:nitrogen fixation protein NifQ [Actinomycetota bacterium]
MPLEPTQSASVPAERLKEYDALVELLMQNASPPDDAARAWAERIASASLEPEHLFHALRFERRDELSDLMRERFNPLFLGNTKNMRWKKYLYKRLCGWEGFHH